MPRLLRSMARTAAIAGTATAVSGRVAHRQAGRWQEQQAAQAPPPQPVYAAPPPPAPAPAAAAASMDDKLQQLQQLGTLKDQGILSDAEFEAQKARILAG
ncbi:SHOCT domain-containing protein [Occultella glacieicola]|uniref:SHOCT domain-containing protein n=1 Tax=Occultella glacieicola TaxID=2518684 RepID=A0ABY2E7C1_9MICO|nr:SHOCT domain-containing protein [Occultella glacieicola]TDE95953.1 SHOCT domain-containing protein [Occultella glacieicola]